MRAFCFLNQDLKRNFPLNDLIQDTVWMSVNVLERLTSEKSKIEFYSIHSSRTTVGLIVILFSKSCFFWSLDEFEILESTFLIIAEQCLME